MIQSIQAFRIQNRLFYDPITYENYTPETKSWLDEMESFYINWMDTSEVPPYNHIIIIDENEVVCMTDTFYC